MNAEDWPGWSSHRQMTVTESSWLKDLAQALIRLLEAALSPTTFKRRNYDVLAAVDLLGTVNQHRLGDFLDIDRTTMVAVVDDLEAQGLLVRTRSPTDRRCYLIRTTRSGEVKLHTVLLPISTEVNEWFFNALDPPERHQLNDLLISLIWPGLRSNDSTSDFALATTRRGEAPLDLEKTSGRTPTRSAPSTDIQATQTHPGRAS